MEWKMFSEARDEGVADVGRIARAENLLAAVFLPLEKMLLKHKNNIKHISASSSSRLPPSLALFFCSGLTLCDDSTVFTFVRSEMKRRRIAFIMSIGSNHLSREMGISVFSHNPSFLHPRMVTELCKHKRKGPPRG
jgi:hypothetical protein